MDIRLKCPFTMLVVGASGTGKTVFTQKVLENAHNVLSCAPQRVVWCHGANVEMEPGIEYFHGLPTEELLNEGNMILIVDDLMHQAKSSSIMADIFTKYAHHNNITCICLIQNLFPKGSEMRNISLNANYVVLMKNSRDRSQIQHLARQVYPMQTKSFSAAYEDATKEPYSYIMMDFRNTTPDEIRLRTVLFPKDTLYVYKLQKL